MEWANETMCCLADIQSSKDAMRRLLYLSRTDPGMYSDLQSDDAVYMYYKILFGRAEEGMSACFVPALGTTLFDLLTDNECFHAPKDKTICRQAFKTAGDYFSVFDKNTVDILVPYGEGSRLITEFESAGALYNLSYHKQLLDKSRLYTLSVYDYELKKLEELGALSLICNNSIYAMHEWFYDEKLGVTMQKRMEYTEC